MMTWMKPLIIGSMAVLLPLTIASCGKKKQTPGPVVIEAPDYEPIAEGWKVQSYALIGVAIIITIGVITRKGDQ